MHQIACKRIYISKTTIQSQFLTNGSFYSAYQWIQPQGMLTPLDIFPVSRTTWFIVCREPNATVYIRENGRRLADHFREHHKDVINGRNDLPVPAHFNQANHTLENMTVVV